MGTAINPVHSADNSNKHNIDTDGSFIKFCL